VPSLRFGSDVNDLPSSATGNSRPLQLVTAAKSFHDGISAELALSKLVETVPELEIGADAIRDKTPRGIAIRMNRSIGGMDMLRGECGRLCA